LVVGLKPHANPGRTATATTTATAVANDDGNGSGAGENRDTARAPGIKAEADPLRG
jgi:hypothetical protein